MNRIVARNSITKAIAGLLRDAERTGAPAEVVAELWALRGLPIHVQARHLPEWLQMRDEWLSVETPLALVVKLA